MESKYYNLCKLLGSIGAFLGLFGSVFGAIMASITRKEDEKRSQEYIENIVDERIKKEKENNSRKKR